MLSWPIDAIAHNAKCPAVIFHALLHVTLHYTTLQNENKRGIIIKKKLRTNEEERTIKEWQVKAA